MKHARIPSRRDYPAHDPERWRQNAGNYCVICGGPGGDPARFAEGTVILAVHRIHSEVIAHRECIARVQARRREGKR